MAKDVLIVDDEESIRELMCDFLDLAGGCGTAVASRSEALAELPRKPYQMVFLDLNLEGGSSRDLIAAIRAGHPSLPLVLMTGESDLDQAPFRSLGVSDFLFKPFQFNQFLDLTRRYVEFS
jgi:DNA-binding NtrC family response regulator